MKTGLYLLTGVVTFLCSCQTAVLEPEAYMRWVNDKSNGLIKEQTVGKVKYTVAYRPGNYQLATSIIDNDSFAMKKNTGKNHCFIIRMEPADGKTQVLTIDAQEKQEPFERINYYLSEAQNDIRLVEGADTLKPASYIYERYYNLSPAQSMVVGFSQKGSLGDKDLQFAIEDRVFSTGKIYFHFDADKLKNIPSLKTK